MTEAQHPLLERVPTLASLGVDLLNPHQLAALSAHLRELAQRTDEIRYLELERRHAVLRSIGNRPALGYYLRLRNEKSARDDTPREVLTSRGLGA